VRTSPSARMRASRATWPRRCAGRASREARRHRDRRGPHRRQPLRRGLPEAAPPHPAQRLRGPRLGGLSLRRGLAPGLGRGGGGALRAHARRARVRLAARGAARAHLPAPRSAPTPTRASI
jgi:hypothetical protein